MRATLAMKKKEGEEEGCTKVELNPCHLEKVIKRGIQEEREGRGRGEGGEREGRGRGEGGEREGRGRGEEGEREGRGERGTYSGSND